MPERYRRPTSSDRDYREWLIEQGMLRPSHEAAAMRAVLDDWVRWAGCRRVLRLDAAGRASAARSIRLADGSDADLFRRPLGWLHVPGR